MAKSNKLTRLAVILAALVSWQSCVTYTSDVRQAREFFKVGDFDKASEILQKAAAENPKSDEIKTMLFRAKLNSYHYHLLLAQQKRKANDRPGATKEYQKALAIFPGNTQLKDEYNVFLNPKLAEKEETAKPTIVLPVQLNIKKDEKVSLSLKNTPITNIFKSLGKTYNVNFIFDKDFRDFLHTMEIENTTFYEVLKVLCLVSGSAYRVLDANTVIVYPDIFAKKKTFDLRGIKTFYLSNIKAEDARKMIQIVFRDEQILIQEDVNLNSVVIRADFNTLAEIERFLTRIDKGKNEVELNVEIMEVNRSIINKIGADFNSGVLSLAAGTTKTDGTISATMNFKDLGSTNFFMTIPSVAMNFLETDANNKIIAKPNLRGIDGEEISFMVGDEVPIAETQFQASAAGGVNNQAVTTYRYRNVGVEIKITPFIHQNNEVTLKTKVTINFISSGASSSFPTFGKREIENKIRLKEGETNIIGGLIRDDMRGSVAGIPALSKIPLLGRLFGASEKTINQTDLIFSITPRIIRKTPISAKDNEPIWSGTEPAASSVTPPEEGEEEAGPPREEAPVGNNLVTIAPTQANIPANAESYFAVRIQADVALSSLALNGEISGGNCDIAEIKTDSLNDNDVKVLKNIAGNHFDIGLSFNKNSGPVLATSFIQLKIRFAKKGKYSLEIGNISAYDEKRNKVEIAPASCSIDVF
jgi:general secretion pathway protein D